MTIHNEILRLRDVVRRVADEPKIDTARKIADEELARPMPQWQTLTDAERSGHIMKFCGGVLTTPKLYALLEKVEQQLKIKNGGHDD